MIVSFACPAPARSSCFFRREPEPPADTRNVKTAKWHWRRLGRAMHRGDLDRAEKLAIAYLRNHPRDTTSWEVWSTVLRLREQRTDEERILRRGVHFTGAPRLRFRLAQILASSGELEEASAILD